MTWKKSPDELVVYSSYAYADVNLPKKFDCVFEEKNPENYRLINTEIRQSIWNGTHPCDFIEHGHNHIFVLGFEKEMDELWSKLPEVGSDAVLGSFNLGLCNSDDLSFISERIKKVAKLRDLYGTDYWKHDMEEKKIKTEKTARVFTVGDVEKAQNIWILCHGYGQLASDFLSKFSELYTYKNFLICPEGLHRFYTKGFSGRVGASWMTKEERQDDIDDYIAWMDTVYENFVPKNTTAKIIVLGFSQGGATVCRWLEKTSHKTDHLVLYASTFPTDVVPSGNFTRYIKGKLFFAAGNEDEFLNEDEKNKQIELLKASGKEVEVISFIGKHEIYGEVLKQIEGNADDAD
ncbi:MAG: dienelactone hydrolase family protein [Bacteroidia bacterium]|nr:dienelactone hydrolase family protein [Bacteroidia bacterium]